MKTKSERVIREITIPVIPTQKQITAIKAGPIELIPAPGVNRYLRSIGGGRFEEVEIVVYDSTMTLDEFKAALAAHDWFYDFSDDHSVWQRGGAEDARLRCIAATSDDHKRVYNEAFAALYHTSNFPKPWKWPFPEVATKVKP